MKRAIIIASVASMIDQFNMENITILQRLGYQVDIAANFETGNSTSQERLDKFKSELIQKKINFYQIPFPRHTSDIKNIIFAYTLVRNLINNQKYEIIHCHSPIGGAITRFASRIARKKGAQVIYTAHGFHFYKGAPKKNWFVFYPIEIMSSHFTDYLITINKEDYYFAKEKKFPSKHIKYVPGVGINTVNHKNHYKNKITKKIEFGITNELVLLSVGELNDNKNHQVVIKAVAELKFPVKYIICGQGNKLNHLKELTKKLQIEDKVVFTGYRSDVNELMQLADVFCFPSHREGLSVALMEAMANGLPVICSKIRGNVDLILEKSGGYLLYSNDVSGFRSKIEQLAKDDPLRKSMGKINVEQIKKFDYKSVNKHMEEIYKECSQYNGTD